MAAMISQRGAGLSIIPRICSALRLRWQGWGVYQTLFKLSCKVRICLVASVTSALQPRSLLVAKVVFMELGGSSGALLSVEGGS